MIDRDSGERPLEYYLDRVRQLPKIPEDDPRVLHFLATGERTSSRAVSNNFFLLWGCLRSDHSSDDVYWNINKQLYLEGAQQYPQWEDFVTQNADAIEAVNETVRNIFNPCHELLIEANMRANGGDRSLFDALDLPEHPYGSYLAAELFVKDAMDDVLGEMADRMEAAGMDPRPFYG